MIWTPKQKFSYIFVNGLLAIFQFWGPNQKFVLIKLISELVRLWVKNPHFGFDNPKIENTGWPKSKFFISNGSTAEADHIWSYVGKVKIGLRGGSFFLVSANFYIHFKYKGEKWQFSTSASEV